MRILSTGCLLFLLAAPLAAQSYAVDRGVWQVGGTGRVSWFRVTGDGPKNSIAELNPRLGYFVAPGLALTANLQLARYGSSGGHVWNYGVGPGLTYYFIHDGRRLHPFLSTRTLLLHTRSSANGGSSYATNAFNWLVSGGAVVLVARNVGLTGELFYAHNHTGYDTGSGSTSSNSEEYGSQFGVSVYLF
jgi:hypothetical protein